MFMAVCMNGVLAIKFRKAMCPPWSSQWVVGNEAAAMLLFVFLPDSLHVRTAKVRMSYILLLCQRILNSK